jgi:beta-xylosidase
LKSGESWFIHFQDRGAYGRIIHLQPMKWLGDWPVIGADKDGDGKGEPVLKHRKPNVGAGYPIAWPQTSDEFDTKRLGLQWQWQANHQGGWDSFAARTGWLRLMAEPIPENATNLWAAANLFLQKLPASEFSVTTRVDFSKLGTNQKAGLIVMGMDYSYVAIEGIKSGFRLAKYSCFNAHEGKAEVQEAQTRLPGTTLLLRVKVSSEALCDFSFSIDGQRFVSIGRRFKAREGKWIGAKVGLFCVGDGRPGVGHGDFDWFRVES